MSSGQGAMFAVHEERATFGGVELAKKTVIAATDEGIVQRETVVRQPATLNFPGSTVYNTTEIRTVETVRTVQPIIQQPALPPPPPPVVPIPPKERTWVDWCFECDSQYEWYNLKGKGICWVLILLLAYLIAGAIVLFFGVAWLVLACLAACSDD